MKCTGGMVSLLSVIGKPYGRRLNNRITKCAIGEEKYDSKHLGSTENA